jgi:single-stranded-DNA-specific exonuclease
MLEHAVVEFAVEPSPFASTTANVAPTTTPPPAAAAPVIVELPRRAGAEAQRLAERLQIGRTLGDWLVRQELGDPAVAERFLNPRLAELSSPETMADRAGAAERLARAISRRERIAIFGDYDCDGMTSAAILTEMLRALGGDVTPLIATRFDGGYGLSQAALGRVLAARPSVLVTCDCGSSDHERLAELGRRGIDCIVVDHHLVPDEPLPALAFLNPHRKECGFAYKGLASCGLVLSLGGAVRAALNRKLDLREWLDLVAIGTIADVAPLDGDNRSLVRAGLRALAQAKRPGLRALMQLARLDGGAPISAEDIAFRLAPRLNAPGRLGAPDASLELLLAQTQDSAELFAARLEQASTERKAQQERIVGEALEDIASLCCEREAAIVVGREGWNHGIVGIVAGRLSERFQRPTVVFGFENGHGHGSARGPAGSRLYDALSRCQHLVTRFGGHQAAAGVELDLARLDEFRAAFVSAIAGAPALPAPSSDAASSDLLWLDHSDAPERVLTDLSLLEPCGLGNPAPALLVEAKVGTSRAVNGGHLKLELELQSGKRLSAFGIAMGERAGAFASTIVVSGRLRPDRYRGGDAVELFLERIF